MLLNNVNWLHFIKNPNSYIDRKIKKLNIKNKNFKKNIFFAHYYYLETKKLKI